MRFARVFVRRPDGTVEAFDDVDEARAAANVGDVIVKVHRGGHTEREAVLPGPEFVPQPDGWRPGRTPA